MKRIVVDVNVLISGTFWNGASFQVLRLVQSGDVTLILSSGILAEYDDVVHRREIIMKPSFEQERIDSVRKILALAVFVEPVERIKAVKDDPDDDKFLEAAVAGDADFLITQDKKHVLPLKEFRGIRIVTPEAFLELAAKFSGD